MTDPLAGWHDFYVLIGTSAGVLIGAMFVVASIGGSFITAERRAATRAFLTPNIFHMTIVLLASAVAVAPTPGARLLGLVLGLLALVGFIYAVVVGAYVWRRYTTLDTDDRLGYGLAPILGQAFLLAAAVLIHQASAAGPLCLALALCCLLAAIIRNAWDLIIFFVAKSNRTE